MMWKDRSLQLEINTPPLQMEILRLSEQNLVTEGGGCLFPDGLFSIFFRKFAGRE